MLHFHDLLKDWWKFIQIHQYLVLTRVLLYGQISLLREPELYIKCHVWDYTWLKCTLKAFYRKWWFFLPIFQLDYVKDLELRTLMSYFSNRNGLSYKQGDSRNVSRPVARIILMEANIGHLPTKFGYNQMQGWKVINRYRILQVNFHILPHLTFDLLMWPLTPEYHGSRPI